MLSRSQHNAGNTYVTCLDSQYLLLIKFRLGVRVCLLLRLSFKLSLPDRLELYHTVFQGCIPVLHRQGMSDLTYLFVLRLQLNARRLSK